MLFKQVPFRALLKQIVDNRGKTCPTAENGIPLIATNCIKNKGLYPIFEKIRYISQETFDTWFRGHPEPGDMVFVVKGSPGQICWVPDPVGFCIAQDMVAIRADEKLVYPKYLFALLRSNYAQNQIQNMHVGTLIPHFKKGDFDKLLLPIPNDYDFQRFAGDSYFRLCEKIELNRKMNRTLEAMAQAIFKSWFVDFEPFRDGGMVDSELGPIPKGWEVMALDEVAEFLNGAACQKYPATADEDSLPVIKIRELSQGVTQQTDRAAAAIPAKWIVEDGDVLFSWSGSLMVKIWTGGKGALNQHLFKVTSKQFPKWFYYLWTKYHLERFQGIAADKATTMGHIKRKNLSDAKVAVPPSEIIKGLGNTLSPLIQHKQTNDIQSRTLAELRDALLPKLISGEVRVPESASLVQAMVES